MAKVLLQVVDAPMPDERMGQKNETGQGDDGEVEENAVPKADFEAAKAAAVIGRRLIFALKMWENSHCWVTSGKSPQYLFHSAAALSGDSSKGVAALQEGHFTAKRLSPTHLNGPFSSLLLIIRWAVPSSKS